MTPCHRVRQAVIAVVVWSVVAAALASAQDMEPRAYSPSPVGANFLVTSYSWSTRRRRLRSDASDHRRACRRAGARCRHRALVQSARQPRAVHRRHPVRAGGRHRENSGRAGGDTPLRAGRCALQAVCQPAGQSGDVSTRVRVIATPHDSGHQPDLYSAGQPVLPHEAHQPRHEPVVLQAGGGRLGAERALGSGRLRGRVVLHVERRFLSDRIALRSQDPLLAIQGHASYTFRPRFWVAADGTWYRGGSARVNEGDPSTTLSNSRLGLTVSFPVGRRYSAKVAYGSGLVARTGTDFKTVAVAWQVLWLSPKWSGR